VAITGSVGLLDLDKSPHTDKSGDVVYSPLVVRVEIDIIDEAMTNLRSLRFHVDFTAVPISAPVNSRSNDDVGTAFLLVQSGATASLSTDSSMPAQHDQIRERLNHPRFYTLGASVHPDEESPYGVEILVNNQPRQPVDRAGRAYVTLQPGDLYAVRLTNGSDRDAAAVLSIDGIDVFAFSKNQALSHVVIPAGSSSVIGGWHNEGDEFNAFQVAGYPEVEAAGLLPEMSNIGTITATFAKAWLPTDAPPLDEPQSRGSSSLATVRGPIIRQRSETVARVVGRVRASVTIRYDRP
jgi:hypothetical protein